MDLLTRDEAARIAACENPRILLPMSKHLKAILMGVVDKSNVIGIRKALNAADRRRRRLSVSSTAPKLTLVECDELEMALRVHEPRVTGPLVESGLARLRNRRYRKRLASVADIIAGITHFALVGFDSEDGKHTPIYRACAGSADNSFLFKNVAWQSGGDGPELVEL